MTRALGFKRRDIQEALLSCYRRHKRILPWRKKPSPYRIWVSEIMLQQTTIPVVMSRFDQFLRKFPTLQSLAVANEESVLAAWAGLGYYSRARNLRLTAQEIVQKYNGKFPKDFESVINLPGIGRYTAGAILSIAFKKPYPVLDGNVTRVFSRILAKNGDPQKFWALAEDLLDKENPGDWNQALMELGETVCVPENPHCSRCPVSGFCMAFKKKIQNHFPAPKNRRPFVDLSWDFFRIEKDNQILIYKRSQKERLLKNHWALPEVNQFNFSRGELLKTTRHTITHHKISVRVFKGEIPTRLPKEARWVSKREISHFLISSLWKKCLPEFGRI